MKSALIIFVRNPVWGKVKTRIAADLGNDVALEVYKKLLSYTRSITKDLPFDRYVFYSDHIDTNDLWQEGQYKKALQKGNDLGERMLYAFIELFKKGYEKVVIIGSDCVELTEADIMNAFTALDNYPVVLGPSHDGGYYLLGTQTLISVLFTNKNWSTDTVFSDTICDLKNLEITYQLLPTLLDIDNGEDCKKYPFLLSNSL